MKYKWNPYLYWGCKWKWRVIIAVNFPINFKQLEGRSLKNIRASMGFEPVTSAVPVRCLTNWDVKLHIGSEVNLLSSYLPVQWYDVNMYEIHICTVVVDIIYFTSFNCTGRYEPNKLTLLSMNSTNWPRSQCVASQLSWLSIAPVSQRSWVWFPLEPWYFSGFFLPIA